MIYQQRLLSTSALALVFSCSVGWSADLRTPDFSLADPVLPAVSAVNGKLALFGGGIDGEGAGGVVGALAFPLGGQFGAQIDGMLGTADDAFYGIGAHVFWRDPSVGLFGGFASYTSWGSSSVTAVSDPVNGVQEIYGADVGKVGIEGEAYLGRISLEGSAAYQFGDETGFAGKATVALYPIDDLRLDLSVRHLEGVGVIGTAGVEWAPLASQGMSLFADASVDEDSDWSGFAGLKFYFGSEQKSLIRRHREDDPDVDLPGDLFTIAGEPGCPAGYFDDGAYCVGPK